MATPHPQSVISTDIIEYSQDLYDSLIEKETYCYNSERLDLYPTIDPVDAYQPAFQNLSDTIVNAYFGGSFDSSGFMDLTQVMYSYIILNNQYGINPSLKDDLHALEIFDMGGLRDSIISRPVDYYDDIIVEDEALMEVSTPNIDADVEFLVEESIEATNNNLSSLISRTSSTVTGQINKLMYHEVVVPDAQGNYDPPSVPYLVQQGDPIPKNEMYDRVFVDFGYDHWLPFFGINDIDPFV